jgi:hypothetical protein
MKHFFASPLVSSRAPRSQSPCVLSAGLGTSLVLALSLVASCGDSSSDGAGGGSADCLSGLTPAANTEYCEASAVDTDCTLVGGTAKISHCGIALPQPPGELTRSSNVDEFAGSGPPDVSCFVPASYPPPPGSSSSVTVKGFARIFSSGCTSNDLRITFYKVKRTGGADDGELGDVVGSAVVTPTDCTATGETSETDDCSPRLECAYEYPNVPTETELAIRTEGSKWSPLIQYNIYIPGSEVVAGVWEHDVRALDQADYGLIPAIAMGAPVASGKGVIAGEVHDCGDVRLSNAVVNTAEPYKTLTYYTSDEDSPTPDLAAKGTSALGLYSAFELNPGPITVAATGLVNGAPVSLGQHRVFIYPDAVTSVTFKGLRPYQLVAAQ